MNPTTDLITQIREKDAKKFGLTLKIERSQSLEWVIVTDASGKQMAIHWNKPTFRLNTVEGYTHTGFIAALETPETVKACRKILREYFTHGYERIFEKMLEGRIRNSDVTKCLTLAEFKREMQRLSRNSKRRKTRPSCLEVPPSLVDTVKEKGGPTFVRPPHTRKRNR